MNRVKKLREEQGLSIEELSDKVGELNDTIYSYGMWASSQPR